MPEPQQPSAAEPTEHHDPVDRSIASLAEMHGRAERSVSPVQRRIEWLTDEIGRPRVLGITLTVVIVWLVVNLSIRHGHVQQYDSPPFFWLQGLIGLCALLMDTMILIKQNRLGAIAERRAQLDLQINLVSEQKITKLIELMEELRRDLPNVRDRHDPVAEAMQRPANPAEVSTALEKAMSDSEAGREVEEADVSDLRNKLLGNPPDEHSRKGDEAAR